MKTAISVPDAVFSEAEKLARRMNKSRSQLYADAMAEYIARHSPETMTEAMNEVWDEVGAGEDASVASAACRILEKVEW